LNEVIVSSCAYRVSTSGLTTNGRNTPRSTFPSPPGSPDLRHLALTDRLQRSGYKLEESGFGEVGKGWTTSDAFEALVRKENTGIGQVWLDGQSVSTCTQVDLIRAHVQPNRPTTTTLASPSFAITYSLSSRTITLHQYSKSPIKFPSPITNFWDLFSSCQQELSSRLKTSRRNEKSKFRGGWVGWFGYEMKEESLAGHLSRRGCGFADWTEDEDVDACWSWVDRFVERSNEGEWTARGVVQDGDFKLNTSTESELLNWLEGQGLPFAITQEDFKRYSEKLTSTLSQPHAGPSHSVAESFPSFHPIITGAQHRDSIDKCREAIRQGESYELTLTTRFDATLPDSPNKQDDTYSLYLRLRARNPAYYSTYISFPTLNTPRGEGVHIISSSPERFLKIDEKRTVEMMPIKGTMARVKPGQCVCTSTTGCKGLSKGSEECNKAGREEDARRADWLRNDKKERAENLMVSLPTLKQKLIYRSST
jgi:para-aminobenzoate synthetase